MKKPVQYISGTKLFLFTFLFVQVFAAQGQVSQYRFSVLSSTFKDLTTANYPGATIAADVTLNTSGLVAARQFVPPNLIPFDFPFYTTDNNNIPLTVNLRQYGFTVAMSGYIAIGQWVVSATEGNSYVGNAFTSIAGYPEVVGLICAYESQSQEDASPSAGWAVRYGIVGTAPNRSFVIQITTGSKTQVWFNEADYSIQIRYDGTNNYGSAPYVGLRGGSTSDFYVLTGSWSSPLRSALNSSKMTGISTTSTMVYNWLPTIYTPSYVTLPYTQDFESTWLDQSSPRNVPDNHWKQQTPTGNFAWMRDDDGATAGWTNPTNGAYTPTGANSSSHSARFHTYNGFTNAQSGILDLYINARATATKNLSYDYINADGSDKLQVSVSVDGGKTFTNIGANNGISTGGTWQHISVDFGSNSRTTIVRFTATRDASGTSDIGIDNVSITKSTNCYVPTLTARFNNVGGTSNKCKTEGNNILSANPTGGGGAPDNDYLEYSWYNGSSYWGGSSFNQASAVWDSAYHDIIPDKSTITATTQSFTVSARFHNSTCSAPSSSSVSWTSTSMFQSPTLIPTANGVPVIYSCASSATLANGAVAGTTIGALAYSWNDGAPRNAWYNGGFNSANQPVFTTTTASISASLASGWQNLYPGYLPVNIKTYTVAARTTGFTSCSTSGTVTVANAAPLILGQPIATNACLGGTVTLTVYARGGATYQWKKNGSNLTNGGRISGATSATLTITGVTAGDADNYSVSITNNCGTTNSNSVAVTTNFQASDVVAKANDTAVTCKMSSPGLVTLTANSSGGVNPTGNSEYCWTDGYRYWDGTGFNAYYPTYNSSYTTITVTVSESTTFTVTTRCSADWLCTNTSQVNVVFPTTCDQPEITPGSTPSFCLGAGSVTLVASGGATDYSWAPGDGLDVTTGETVVASPSATTTYTVTGTGCTTPTAVLTVSVYQAPTVTAQAAGTTGSVNICPGNVTLTANPSGGTGAAEYAWSDGSNYWNGTTFSSATPVYNAAYSSITVTASTTKTYSVTARTSANTACVSNSSSVVVVVVYEAPTLTAKANDIASATSICPGGSVTLTANAVNGTSCSGTPQFSWFNGSLYWDGSSFASASPIYSSSFDNFSVSLSGNTTFMVSGRCSNQVLSCSSSSTVAVTMAATNPVSLYITAGSFSPTATPYCSDNTLITYTAVPANPGASPIYQWKKNGSNVGTNSTTYTDASTPATGDEISCTLTSNISCPVPSAVATATGTSKVFTSPNCSCASTIAGTASATRGITRVQLNGATTNLDQRSRVNNASPYYTFFYSATVPDLVLSNTYSVTIKDSTTATFIAGYIDYNQNGVFTDAGEQIFITASAQAANSTVSYSLTVPATATTGITIMRLKAGSNTTSVAPCSGTGGAPGETEDYWVNIVSNCTPPTVTAPTVTQPTCAVNTGTIVVNATGSGTLEYSKDGSNWQTSDTFSGLAASTSYNISARLQATPGCVTSYSANPVVINAATGCDVPYTVKIFIQGYYSGSSLMSPLLKLLNLSVNAADVDTVTVELHAGSNPYGVVETKKGILQMNGNVNVSFTTINSGDSYFIAVKHRNSLETWSDAAVAINAGGLYDFTTAANKAYGNNLVSLDGGVYGIYNGDITGDGIINAADKLAVQNTLTLFKAGVYNLNDITGDGFVDEDDYLVIQNNNAIGVIASAHP